jgi:hypothetical protein
VTIRVVLGEDTTVAAASGIVCEPIRARTVKGREEPVEVYRVLTRGDPA